MYLHHVLLFLLCISQVTANEEFEYIGVEVNVTTADNKPKTFLVKRNIPKACESVYITPHLFWSEHFAHQSVPEVCKSTYIHTKGKLLAISLDPEVETYGELEVLAFIKEMQHNKQILLIDGRTEKWYKQFTIPGAANVPFVYFKRPKEFEFEFEDALKFFGVKIHKENQYDFSKAKTLILFCNGSWCTQSPDIIYALLEIGYPPEKLKWYRGGMQSWLAAGMTTTRESK